MVKKRTANKLLFSIGSLLLTNGVVLLLAPARYATLRKSGWMPDRANRMLDDIARDELPGRWLGLGATALGIILIGLGVARARPTT